MSLAYDAGNALCGLTVGGQFQWVSRTLPDLTQVFSNGGASGVSHPDPPGAIAVDSDGGLVIARDASEGTLSSGLHLEVVTPTGTQSFVHDKPDSDPPFIIISDGVQLRTLAADRHARHIAIGGDYNQSQPWIQVYAMPAPTP